MHKTYVCMYVDSAPTAVQQNGISLHCQSNQRINQATNQQTNHASKHFRKRHTKLRNKNAILTHTNKQTKEKPSRSQLNCMATQHPIRQVAYRICELLAALRKRSCWRWQAEVDALSRWHADNEPAEADVGTEVELEFAFAFWFGLSASLWPSRRIACQLASCAYCCFSFFFFLFRFLFFVAVVSILPQRQLKFSCIANLLKPEQVLSVWLCMHTHKYFCLFVWVWSGKLFEHTTTQLLTHQPTFTWLRTTIRTFQLTAPTYLWGRNMNAAWQFIWNGYSYSVTECRGSHSL